jgi:hypothetical protein
MRYVARLTRLENLMRKDACPFCRLTRRTAWSDSTKPRPMPKDPSLLVTTLCEECGAPSKKDLSIYPAELRGIIRLQYASSQADGYTNPRVWAAIRWITYYLAALAAIEQHEELRVMRDSSAPAQSAYERQRRDDARQRKAGGRARTIDQDVRLYKELRAEVQALSARRRMRLEQQYGARPFPELEDRIAAVRGPDYALMFKGEPYAHDVPINPILELGREAESWAKCAELEKIALGDVTAFTVQMLADCERHAREVIAGARAKHEEREESQRREEAERESARLKRLDASAPEARTGSSILANLGRTRPPSAVGRIDASAHPSYLNGQDYMTTIDSYDDDIDPSMYEIPAPPEFW